MKINESWIASCPIAHRGLFGENIPENSLASFKNAIKNKLPIEFNVTHIADGTPVVFHDEKLARMTGRDGFIANTTLEELSKITLAGTKEKIPTLAQALEVIDGKVPILIEIKNYGNAGVFEKAVWKCLQDYKGHYAITSYNPFSLEWFKKNAPNVKRGQLSSFFKEKEITGLRRFTLKRMLHNKKVSEPHFIIYNASDMPNKYVKKYYGKLPILACPIKSQEEADRLAPYCDNIIFDSFMPQDKDNK